MATIRVIILDEDVLGIVLQVVEEVVAYNFGQGTISLWNRFALEKIFLLFSLKHRFDFSSFPGGNVLSKLFGVKLFNWV